MPRSLNTVARIALTGRLICSNEEESATVRRCLPRHVQLTRAEPGCLSFEVRATADPRVWRVDELFADRAAFDAHQERVAASEWGRLTAAIERAYEVREA